MARINIEDSIYRDNRFIKLTIKLGNLDTALGALVRAWALAQKYYLSPHKMIPKAVWDEQEINQEIINVGLAEVVEVDFIRLKGADEQFAWLRQRQESGKLGGLKSLRNSQAVGKRSVSGSKPLTLSLSLEEVTHIQTGNAIASPKFDLERVYQAYPKKLGKSEGMSRLKAMIKTDEDYQAFEKAVANYAAYIKREKIEARFIKQFSSFVGSQKVQPWRDYLDDDVGKTLQDRKAKKVFYTVEEIENDLRQKS
jgi:hypothetical protein